MINLADITLADTLLRFAGRLHPVLVHFPIALFVVAAFLEVLRLVRRKPDPSPSAITCVIIGAVGAAAAAFSGWMNADFEPQSNALADTLFWHRWLGVSVAAVGVILAGMAISAKLFKAPTLHRIYALLLIATSVIVGFTAHQGGSMVYGPEYLFEVFNKPSAPTPPATAAPPDSQGPLLPLPPAVVRTPPAGAVLTVDFARDIQPIFDASCVECHRSGKTKGGLRLDHPTHLFENEEDIWVVRPSSPDASELVRRLVLPKNADGHMPPDADSLPPEQIEKIKQWIAEGAYWSGPIKAPPSSEAVPSSKLPAPPQNDAPAAEAPVWKGDEVAAIDSLRAIGARVEPIAAGAAELDINLSLAGVRCTDQHAAAVAHLGPRVRSLNLARTAITDAGAAALHSCTALQKLHLEGTAVGDASLEAISKLAALQYLNLNGSKVTNAGIAKLASCKSLRNLYVSDTAVTLDAAMKLQEALPSLNIEFGVPSPK